MFKIRKKQKSAPKRIIVNRVESILQVNRYRCLKEISDSQQHWKNLLRNQLQMGSTIVAFQNVQISMRVDAQKKLMLRETFMLKKQIIKLIVSEQYQLILPKLEQLRKTSAADYGLATLFIDFYHIQKQIIANKLEYRQETIKQIKCKMEKYYQKLERQKGSIIFGRILYITALHLIKLDGVLIKNEDINIIIQALISKKKELCMISSDIQKSTLQSLLFLTFQFYKILYLLKRDQDLITQYYNQIQAYTSIYKTKCGHFQDFQKEFKIIEKIQKIKPLNLNLKIYEDHERRRVLSVQNTQEQLMKNHFPTRNTTILSSQITAEMRNRDKKGLVRMSSFQSSCDKNSQSQLKVNDSEQMILKHLTLPSKENDQQIISCESKFCFQFIKPDQLAILRGKFQVTFSDNFEQFQVRIIIQRGEGIVGMFKIGGFGLEKKNLGDCAKKLWRVIKQRFYTDKTEFLPNLFSFEYPPFHDIPKHINVTYELPILVRIHEMLLHYLRKHTKLSKMNGSVIVFPAQRVEQEKKQLDVPNPEYRIFAKRYGFISFNKKLRKLHSNRNMRMISMDRETENELKLTFMTKQETQYSIIHIDLSKNSEKRILIYTKNMRNIKSEGNMYLERQKIENLCLKSQNQWRRRRVIHIIDYMQNYKEEDEYFITGVICVQKIKQSKKNIEEEFEVMKSPILETRRNEIKRYRKFNYAKYNTNLGQIEPLPFKTIRIQDQYLTFRQKRYPTYTQYFDASKQFILCPQNMNKTLVYTKFRLYKSVIFKDQFQNQFMKVGRVKKKNQDAKTQIKIKNQKIEVKWMRTRIGKTVRSNTYYYLNVFAYGSKSVISVYEFGEGKNYMGISQDNKTVTQWLFNQELMTVNDIKMEEFVSVGGEICDAQEYVNRWESAPDQPS